MPLHLPSPPAGSKDSLREALTRLQSHPSETLSKMTGGGEPPVANPHRVYTIDASAIARGASASQDSRPVGWSYLMASPGPGMGGSNWTLVQVAESQGVHRFSQAQQGWISRATQDAIEAAKLLPEVAAGNYELRVLRIPALLLDALWLKSEDGKDLMIPVASPDPAVVTGKVSLASDFLKSIQDLAKDRIRFDDRPLA